MSKLLAFLTIFAIGFSTAAYAVEVATIEITPKTESIEVIDGSAADIARVVPGMPAVNPERIFIAQGANSTLVKLELPKDGIYKIWAGQRETRTPSDALIAIQNGQTSVTPVSNVGGYKIQLKAK